MFDRLKAFFLRKTAFGLYNSVDRLSFEGVGPADFLKYNHLSLYTNRAIAKRADKVGEIQFVLRKGETELEKHELLTLLNKPNEYHTGAQFWSLYQKHLDITGAAFIFLEAEDKKLFQKSGKVKAMHLLNPANVTILRKKGSIEIVGYEYRIENGGKLIYTADQVLFSFNPDPSNPLMGESLLRAGVRQIDTDVQLSDYQNSILRNGGRVEGVFTFKSINKEQLTQAKDSYKDQFATAKKAGLPLFLGGEADYKNVALSPSELSYLESKKVSLNDICIMTGVPKAVLASIGDETFANADAAHNIFLRETIKPLLRALTTFLDYRLVPEDLDLTFVDPTPEDVDRKIKLLTAASAVNAVTTNEKREMLGMDPIKGDEADAVLVPFSVQPLATITEEEPEVEEEETPEEKRAKSIQNHPLRDPFIRKKYGEIMYKRLTRLEKKYKQAIVRLLNDQGDRIISRITGAKHYRRKSLIDDAFDEMLEIQLTAKTVLPLLEQIVKESGQDVYRLFDTGFEFNLTAELRSWALERSNVFATDVTATTLKRLNEAFEDSIAADETRQELVKRIEAIYDGFTKSRAQTIARTETHGAVQRGTIDGYKQAGVPVKIWVHIPGVEGGVRDDHAAMDGDEVPIDAVFANGLRYPGDPSGGPEDTINCACTL